MGIGAQFGGKYFCHDVRVVRLPRHGASCPVGLGVSCSADRQVGVGDDLMYLCPRMIGTVKCVSLRTLSNDSRECPTIFMEHLE